MLIFNMHIGISKFNSKMKLKASFRVLVFIC